MGFTIPEFEPYQLFNPLSSALSGYMEGKKFKVEYQKQQLANQLAQKKLPYAEQDIQTTIALKRAEIKSREAEANINSQKAQHPYMFAPPELAPYLYLGEQRQQQSQGQGQSQPNPTFSYGGMTTTSGRDIPNPQQQLSKGFMNNTSSQNTQDLDLNDPLTYLDAKYNPATKQRIDAALAEQSGKIKGIENEGAKLGEFRANDINELDTQYGQMVQSEAPINHLIDMVKDPVFMNSRNKIPFFQDKQLEALSKIGTPEEQKQVGDFLTSANTVVANAVQGFKGKALEKEFTLEDQMNISPHDTWNAMVGKLESIKTYKELIKQRNRAAVKLMQEKHVNKGDALEQADKLVNGDKIREKIKDELKPKRTVGGVTYHQVNGKWLPVQGEK